MEYIFTLKYRLPDVVREISDLVERLGEGGCDDALVGMGVPGRLALEFSREGESARLVIYSALADVKGAIPSARFVEAAPDLAGLTDAAEFAGVSRQNLRKLMLAHPHSFPSPVHDGSTSLWHLADVLAWLVAQCGYVLETRLLEVIQATKEINQAREAFRLPGTPARELELLLE